MVQNTLLKIARNLTPSGMTEPVTVRRACDGPFCRSVATVRELFQMPISQKSKCSETVLTTVRRDCDGPSCTSVTEFRDSLSRLKFIIPSVLVRDTLDGPSCPRRSVVVSVTCSQIFPK